MPVKVNVLAELSREVPSEYKETGGFIGTAYECAVVERYNDKGRFEYYAVNLRTRKEELLERRREPIMTGRAMESLLRKLRDSRIAGLGRYEIAPKCQLPRIREVVHTLFREILPQYGYTIREEQIRLADEMPEAIANHRVLLAEAAVGIGKTIVYIIISTLIKRSQINLSWSGSFFPGMSCVEWQRMPFLISTSSIALQRAITEDYIPAISDILIENGVIRKPLKTVLRKGKEHYCCEYNLRLYRLAKHKPETAELLDMLVNNEDIIDLSGVDAGSSCARLTAHIKSRICVPAKCYKDCPYSNDCRYLAFRKSASVNAVDFAICNHNLLLADAKMRADEGRQILPPFQGLVIDETHKFLPAARSIYGTELSADIIPETTKAILELNYRPQSEWDWEMCKPLRDTAYRLAEKLYGQDKRLFAHAEPTADCDKLLRNIRDISDILRKTLNEYPTLFVRRDEERKHSLMWSLQQISKSAGALSDSTKSIRWFDDDDGRNVALAAIPKDLDSRLHSDLWQRGIPTVLTSGTLAASGDFSVLRQSLGLNKRGRLSETTHASPFNYRENCLLYLTESVQFPEPKSERYINAVTDEIERLIRASNGNAAVLFTSYCVMGIVHGRLKERNLPNKLFLLERNTSNAIERFKAEKNGVLFASGALWEGIDIPGDALSMLIIVKLPFAVPDAIAEHTREQYADFNEYRECILVPEMLIKLKQGFGRLIRTETDTGVAAILDSRATRTARTVNECLTRCLTAP